MPLPKFACLSGALLLSLCVASPACAEAPDRDAAAQVTAMIDAWRAEHGLPSVPRSAALDKVAEAHVLDMASAPDRGAGHDLGRDAQGRPCNLHSWSARGAGRWSPVCYTGDHAAAAGMWVKPKEIVGAAYPAPGFEIAAWSSADITARQAVEGWKRSQGHNDVMLEQGASWQGARWQAMGVAVMGHYAFVWFGKEDSGERMAYAREAWDY